MRFEEAYSGWQAGRLRQEEAARLLGVCERSFRRYIDRYEEAGLQGLIDRRMGQISHRRAPVDEVMALTTGYQERHEGWSAKHYHSWYRRAGGVRRYSWVKHQLQKVELVIRAPKRGAHRKRRDRAPLPGMLVHQDGSSHAWVPEQRWDLIVTMDDATSEHYVMEFVEEEGTRSSFRGVAAVIRAHGLFSAFYSDRGSHYWFTPKVGGKVDRRSPTQFGRALRQLGAAPSAPFAPIRIVYRRSWRSPASPPWQRRTGICATSTSRASTPSSRNPPWRPAPPSCRGWGRTWMRFSASTLSARSAPTTASRSRARSCRSQPSAIAATS